MVVCWNLLDSGKVTRLMLMYLKEPGLKHQIFMMSLSSILDTGNFFPLIFSSVYLIGQLLGFPEYV